MKVDLKSISVSLLAILIAVPFIFSFNGALSFQDEDKIEFEYEEELKDASESRLDFIKFLLDSSVGDGDFGFLVSSFDFFPYPGNRRQLISESSITLTATVPLYLLFCNLKIYSF
ncbi:MAG: hypothetical protein ACI8TA_001456 [Cyclobacteriaceae bacterium]|jgi:hypothetical protein